MEVNEENKKQLSALNEREDIKRPQRKLKPSSLTKKRNLNSQLEQLMKMQKNDSSDFEKEIFNPIIEGFNNNNKQV